MMRRWARLIGILCLLLAQGRGTAAHTFDATPPAQAFVDPRVSAALAALAPDEMATVMITLRDQADLTRIDMPDRASRIAEVKRRLMARADASQSPLRELLARHAAQGRVARATYFWIHNGISLTAVRPIIELLAARSDILKITPGDTPIILAEMRAAAVPEPNLSLISAPDVWELGFRGQGIVVANLDTGVDLGHPDLAGRWRGGSNSWYDPYDPGSLVPTDLEGHGTWTMGVMLAGDAGGASVGVAPDAHWIAARIFHRTAVGLTADVAAVHAAFQWLLDPDGNPDTADAPHVVNNSWSYGTLGCDLEFQLDLQALLAAGILPIFAAGNFGPTAATSVSPANYPEALAVGATRNDDAIYTESSRGPSACDPSAIYPTVTAPGVSETTTDLFGGYYAATGTSIAAPHVTGVAALLLNAFPDATVYELWTALTAGAIDLGAPGPDDIYGYGRIDALAAFRWLQARYDLAGPEVNALALLPGPVAASAILTATVTDQPTPNAPPAELAAAEWFVGTDPGPGAGTPMTAVDGAFDSPSEVVSATLDISGWTSGVTQTLAVRGLDALGNWGAVSSRTVARYDQILHETAGSDFNWVGLPVDAGLAMASDLKTDVETHASGAITVSAVAQWNAVSQNYTLFSPVPFVHGDFPLAPGRAYRVTVDLPDTVSGSVVWTLVGVVPEPSAFSYTLMETSKTDYNWLLLPWTKSDLVMASELRRDIETSAVPTTTVITVQQWHAISQNLAASLLIPLEHGDFTLTTGLPYRVTIDVAAPERTSTWP